MTLYSINEALMNKNDVQMYNSLHFLSLIGFLNIESAF